MQARGAYTAERAAALSGVPKSTLHYWSNNDVLVPSVSPQRIKLWSYGDLMALRTIYWLRQTKQDPDGREIPKTAMKAVRRALREIASLELDLWNEDGAPRVAVDRSGNIVIGDERGSQRTGGQRILDAEMLDLLAPFDSREGLRGPDLSAPRPQLRIVPGKLAGSPHRAHQDRDPGDRGARASRDREREDLPPVPDGPRRGGRRCDRPRARAEREPAHRRVGGVSQPAVRADSELGCDLDLRWREHR